MNTQRTRMVVQWSRDDGLKPLLQRPMTSIHRFLLLREGNALGCVKRSVVMHLFCACAVSIIIGCTGVGCRHTQERIGHGSSSDLWVVPPTLRARSDPLPADPWALQEGDNLAISLAIPGNREIAIERIVSRYGDIPLLSNKVFLVAGKRRDSVEAEIHDYYVPKVFSNVVVSVRNTSPELFKVQGEVRSPYRGVFMPPITVLEAIEWAEGFTEEADRKHIEVITEGKCEYYNYSQIAERGTNGPCLRPGDVIMVRPRKRWLRISRPTFLFLQ